MIKFTLTCDRNHEFESWFQNSETFDHQAAKGLVECPQCHSVKVSKAIMAPFVAVKTRIDKSHGEGAAREIALASEQMEIRAKIRALHEHVTKNAEDVGEKFPEEVRKQHFGESEEKPIYGKASAEDVSELLEEGIPVFPLPDLPEELN